MTLKQLLSPALYLMNKLSFKSKIIFSIVLLSILLLFPSRTMFLNYYDKGSIYDKRLSGLEYIEIVYKIIETVQKHRTLSKIYLSGNTDVDEDIRDNEEKFYNQKASLLNYDAEHFKIIASDQDFAKAISLFKMVTLDKFDSTLPEKKIFQTHIEIIEKLIKTILTISKESTFSKSQDLKINYLADMLQSKLLYLYEYTHELKDLSYGDENKNETVRKKKLLDKLTINLNSLKLNLKENSVLTKLDNYPLLEEKTTSVSYKLETLLTLINNNNSNSNYNLYNNPILINKISSNIVAQEELYQMFVYTYKQVIQELRNDLENNISKLILLFLAIIFIALYIFVAFYQSITSNLKKLQTASELISSGQTKITLQVDKKDEIGDALLAFNTMSEKLDENISFLDGYKTAIDNSSIVSKTNLKGTITYVNQLFCDTSGYSKKELLGRSHNIIRHPDMKKSTFKDMWSTIKAKKVWKGIVKNLSKNGETYIVKVTVLPILNRYGKIIEYIAIRHDITELEKSKEEIKKQRTDLLTGLPNRNQLVEDLKSAINPTIFYMNIDDFSGFNEFYGTEIGDNVLINLANILREMQKKKHFQLYKFQSDQFILLFKENYFDDINFHSFCEELIEDIEKQISTLQIKNQNRVNISLSSGAANHYAHDNYQNLILYANIARKKAQEQQKKFVLFDHSMRKSENYAQNIEWINKIKEALVEDRIVTYYQPIIDNATGKIVKYETLVRMLDKEGNTVPTWTFLEIAQKAKLYPQVTKIVINKAFQAFEEFPQYEFSVNLTIDDILSKEITEFIYDKLKNYNNSHRVIFEITESEEVRDYKIINNFIENVTKYGVKIAIDDFGSGYANFEHIISINAHFIKIDGSLIKNIDTDKNARIITEAIINFSKKLGKKTIAEFIHCEEIYDIVKDLGADYSQGFHLGMPSPIIKQS
jgi:PAS domain S-box-containing protein/diguanylate cyclase (GGDEF)-like protein